MASSKRHLTLAVPTTLLTVLLVATNLTLPLRNLTSFNTTRAFLEENRPPSPSSSAASSARNATSASFNVCPQVDTSSLLRNAIRPHWVPSYPGSGSELVRDLVQSITGLEARNAYDDLRLSQQSVCQQNSTIACKTHWPVLRRPNPYHDGHADDTHHHHHSTTTPPPLSSFHSETVLLIRNPMAAIPSYFNQWWEARQPGVSSHSQQAPEHAWLRWRDQRFAREMTSWRKLLEEWYYAAGPTTMTNGTFQQLSPRFRVTLLVPMEELIDETTGPDLTQRLLHVLLLGLNAAPSNTTTNASDICQCHWQSVVQDKPRKQRQNHTYTPQFTENQLKRMQKVLQGLIRRFSSKEEELVQTLRTYLQSVDHVLATSGRTVA